MPPLTLTNATLGAEPVDPDKIQPIPDIPQVVFLKPLLASRPGVQRVSVGDYSYYSDFVDATSFFEKNVLYNFGYSGVALRIGKYCAFAHGTTFVMADANHPMVGPSTYPFPVFGGAWAAEMGVLDMPEVTKGDTVVGNDVWLGHESLVMPGVTIGDGAIVGARSVVSRDVAPYTIVAGNPARVIRQRFDQKTIEHLQALAWWDWPAERVAAAVPVLLAGDAERLAALAPGA
jgi:virginiamycin A acetyltransferase